MLVARELSSFAAEIFPMNAFSRYIRHFLHFTSQLPLLHLNLINRTGISLAVITRRWCQFYWDTNRSLAAIAAIGFSIIMALAADIVVLGAMRAASPLQ